MALIDTDHTLVVVWVCCSLSILIMVSRLVGGKWCKKKFDLGDALTVVAIFLSFARIALTHVVILWKTNNISPSLGDTYKLSNVGIHHREIGSKFTLVARCLYIIL